MLKRASALTVRALASARRRATVELLPEGLVTEEASSGGGVSSAAPTGGLRALADAAPPMEKGMRRAMKVRKAMR